MEMDIPLTDGVCFEELLTTLNKDMEKEIIRWKFFIRYIIICTSI